MRLVLVTALVLNLVASIASAQSYIGRLSRLAAVFLLETLLAGARLKAAKPPKPAQTGAERKRDSAQP